MNQTKKLAIVTGGTRGIGAAVGKRLQADGFRVAALYFGNEKSAEQFKKETRIDVYKADVSSFDSCQVAIDEITETYGTIDVVVNNAGITRDGFLHKMSSKDWNDVIATNLTSCFNLCRLVVPGMRERGYGRIINISSINGLKGQFGQTNYSAAKAGILGFTKALAAENAAKGITVNAVCPGYIETEMTLAMKEEVLAGIVKEIPMGRMGKPSEIASLIAYLASDDAAFITGATFSANGGQFMG